MAASCGQALLQDAYRVGLIGANLLGLIVFLLAWSLLSTIDLGSVTYLTPTQPGGAERLEFGGTMSWIKTDPFSHHFVDELNRTRIFHGVNVVFKQPPFVPDADTWDPFHSFTERDAKDLRHWGFNVIRLGVMWAGTFPANPDAPDPSYMAAVQRIVKLCGAHGLYVIVDMHSDVMSRRFCGNGMPDWAVDRALESAGYEGPFGNFPAPLYDQADYFDKKALPQNIWMAEKMTKDAGAKTALEVMKANAPLYPKLEACLSQDFFSYYKTDAAVATVHALYTNGGGIRDDFEKHWKHVAYELKDTPAVLMYDVLNEPFFGHLYGSKWWFPMQWYMDNDYTERPYLADFQGRARDAIRSIDERRIIGSEPSMLNYWARNFGRPQDKPENKDRDAMSWHNYCSLAPGSAPWEPLRHLCPFLNSAQFSAMTQNTREMGGGSILTEFGSLGNMSTEKLELQDVVNLADSRLLSRVYWQYKTYKDISSSGGYGRLTFYPHGELQTDKIRLLATPYAQIVAGEPKFMRYDPARRALVLEYIAARTNTRRAATSLFHLNTEMHYPEGFMLLSDASGMRIRLNEGSMLEVEHTDELAGQSIIMCVLPCPEGDSECTKNPGKVQQLPFYFWHPCGARTTGLRWDTVFAFTSLLFVQLIVREVYMQRRERKAREALPQTTEDAEVSDTQYAPSVFLAVTMFVLGVLMSFARWASLDLPFYDEPPRWATFLLMLVPVLWAATLLTQLKSPLFVAGCVLLMVMWRLSHFLLDPMTHPEDWLKRMIMRIIWMITTSALGVIMMWKALGHPWVEALKERLLSGRPVLQVTPTEREGDERKLLLSPRG
eukprot:TRINITY_DN23495_c0_g1_i1.p1 TRINITY_DN23495_c0_g1~~TRINITY_DN23495_c0_g1_i1.p1  ORF type:complete len:832 (+),score=141.29 TRINITY_DN23495_c0_g1_i1:100-2595(+)